MRNEEKPSKNLSGNAEEIADFGGLSPGNIKCDSFLGERIQPSYSDIFVLPDTICFVG